MACGAWWAKIIKTALIDGWSRPLLWAERLGSGSLMSSLMSSPPAAAASKYHFGRKFSAAAAAAATLWLVSQGAEPPKKPLGLQNESLSRRISEFFTVRSGALNTCGLRPPRKNLRERKSEDGEKKEEEKKPPGTKHTRPVRVAMVGGVWPNLISICDLTNHVSTRNKVLNSKEMQLSAKAQNLSSKFKSSDFDGTILKLFYQKSAGVIWNFNFDFKKTNKQTNNLQQPEHQFLASPSLAPPLLSSENSDWSSRTKEDPPTPQLLGLGPDINVGDVSWPCHHFLLALIHICCQAEFESRE